MSAFKVVAGVSILAVVLSLAGCPVGDERLSNQGGGSFLTAGVKVVRGDMTSLTPDEVQILGDQISQLQAELDVDISDEQASAAVEFMAQNNLQTVQDIRDLVENPGDVVVPESVQALVEADNLPDIKDGENGN